MTPDVAEFGDPRVPDYLWRKVHVAPSGCWEWTGIVGHGGYGEYHLKNDLLRRLAPLQRHQRSHRVFYALLVGPIEPGTHKHVDHLCRNRICCNPAHLRYVPAAVNYAAVVRAKSLQTHCHRGHDITDPENVIPYIRNGRTNRRCRACRVIDSKIANDKVRERRRAARHAAA